MICECGADISFKDYHAHKCDDFPESESWQLVERPVTGKILTRRQAAQHARSCGWFQVKTAGGPVPVSDWAESAYDGERLLFVSERVCHELVGLTLAPSRDIVSAVWTFGT